MDIYVNEIEDCPGFPNRKLARQEIACRAHMVVTKVRSGPRSGLHKIIVRRTVFLIYFVVLFSGWHFFLFKTQFLNNYTDEQTYRNTVVYGLING